MHLTIKRSVPGLHQLEVGTKRIGGHVNSTSRRAAGTLLGDQRTCWRRACRRKKRAAHGRTTLRRRRGSRCAWKCLSSMRQPRSLFLAPWAHRCDRRGWLHDGMHKRMRQRLVYVQPKCAADLFQRLHGLIRSGRDKRRQSRARSSTSGTPTATIDRRRQKQTRQGQAPAQARPG